MKKSKIHLKAFGALLFGVLGIIASAQIAAATLYGKVVDEKTVQPLQYAWGTTYKWDPDYKYWSYAGDFDTGSDGTFKITSLSAGTYYLVTSKFDYYQEYYDNVTSFANKTKFTLTATQSKNLGTIKLKPLPVSITRVQGTPTSLPDSGGNVVLTTTIENRTGLSYNTYFWVNLLSQTVDGSATSSTLVAPYKITIPATGLIFKRTIAVPSSAPNGNDYYLFTSLGSTIWSPLTSPHWGASFWKGTKTQIAATPLAGTEKVTLDVAATGSDQLDTAFTDGSGAAPLGLSQPRIPELIAEDGTVLKWREAH